MAVHDNCILVGGYSQPPRDTGVTFTLNTLACQLLINKTSHCVVECHFNVPSPLTQAYLNDLVMGHCMDDDIEPLLEKIRLHLHLQITNSVNHALRNALERYHELDMKMWKSPAE